MIISNVFQFYSVQCKLHIFHYFLNLILFNYHILLFYLKYRYIGIEKMILVIIISSLISDYKHNKQQYNFYLS